ncbi:efflux RND transporter permease subunit [Alicyclobacillaceae bacterium I2511]|nr:efflux RND transporter permease subunit [Alicyclobacillaceae bacterium I2511]
MDFTRFAIRRPIAMLMLFAAVLVMGVMAYTQLPVRRLPNVNFPHITVTLQDPGANSNTVRTQVVDPVENALMKIGGIVTMTANARNGAGQIGLRFPGGTNIDTAANEVAQVVNQMAGELPAGTQPPIITKADPNALPVMNVAVYGLLNQASLYNLVANTIQPGLMAVPGVATVNLVGGHAPQVNVLADPVLLSQYGVTLATLRTAIATRNMALSAGTSQQGSQTYPVQVAGRVTSLTGFNNLWVPYPFSTSAPASMTPAGVRNGSGEVPLSGLAQVSQGYAPVTTVSHLNGQTAIGLVISVQSTANSLATASGVRAEIAHLATQLPNGVHMVVTGDVTQYTKQAMTATEADLFFAVLAAALMIAFWLHRLRLTLVVLVAIPTTLCATFLAMYFLHFSLDSMSLMALSLLIGILVDDVIVVLENIVRHYHLGKSKHEAAWLGRREIAGAALAITLTDVVVYAPVAFMQGNIGQLFREFGLTIVFATLFSLFVSFTLTPLLAAHFGLQGGAPRSPQENRLKSKVERWQGTFERGFVHLQDVYVGSLRTAIRRWPWVVLVAVTAVVFDVAVFRFNWVPTTYTPAENSSVVFVNVQMPTGTGIDATDTAVAKLSQEIEQVTGVTNVFSTTGFGSGSATGSNIGRLTVNLRTGPGAPTVFSVVPEVEQLAGHIPGMKVQTNLPNALVSDGGGPQLSIVLRGGNLLTLDGLALQLEQHLQSIPGLRNVASTAQKTVPQLSIQVNPQAAATYGLTTKQVGQAVQLAIQGATVSQYQPTPTALSEPVVMQLNSPLSSGVLNNLPIGVTGGQTVTLGQVATVAWTASPVSEQEYNQQLEVGVTANTGTTPLGTVVGQVRKVLKKLPVPPGYSVLFNGAVQQQARAFAPLMRALELGVVFIYMLLAALYESFFDPLAVLLTLPLAITGALLGLWVTGLPFSLYAFIALIMLVGLVAKNAILLIDYAKRGFAKGQQATLAEALIAAGRVRLRPILMTTGTMVLAMLPLSLHLGAGASTRMPMAIVLMGGMSVSTLLTLFVLPVFYLGLHQLKGGMGWLVKKAGRG